MTDNAELRALLDRDAIRDLIHRHADCASRGDFVAMERIYHPDCTWESPAVGLRFETAREWIDFLIDTTSRLELMFHTANNPVVDLVDEHHARASTLVREMVRSKDPGALNLDVYGVYDDELTRGSEGWGFSRRVFLSVLMVPDTVAGDVMTQRQDLKR